MDRRVLIIDDDPGMLEMLRAELERRDYTVASQTSPEAALRLLAEEDFGVVLSDISMRGMSGVDLCREVVTLREDTPVIVMTAFASIETAVSSIRAGAYDFVTKPFDADDLALTLDRALRHHALREEVKRLRSVVDRQGTFGGMIGESSMMKRMYDVLWRVSDTEATVLITGESGTGKELVSRAIHDRGARAKGPFVAINCAAMTESLLESELFGHVKGAFTDARSARAGLFQKATGGTLFLDEVGEMPLGMQAKLLRALQERVVRPVGGDVEVPFDTRIITATNRDLEEEVEERRFREDLYYRINVVHVEVPPLRQRENDVLLLARAFMDRNQPKSRTVTGLKKCAVERLAAYPWPGNVRELQNCIERAMALTAADSLSAEDLPDRIAHYKPKSLVLESCEASSILSMDEVEERYVSQVLDALAGNKASAARLLGIDRRTLYRKLDGWRKGAEERGSAQSPSRSGGATEERRAASAGNSAARAGF